MVPYTGALLQYIAVGGAGTASLSWGSRGLVRLVRLSCDDDGMALEGGCWTRGLRVPCVVTAESEELLPFDTFLRKLWLTLDEPAEAPGAREGDGFVSVTGRCKLRELDLREAPGIRWVDGPATCD